MWEQQRAWSTTHLATFKAKWSHTVQLISDRLHTRWSSGHISMERCFSKQTIAIQTSLTELTHLEGSGFPQTTRWTPAAMCGKWTIVPTPAWMFILSYASIPCMFMKSLLDKRILTGRAWNQNLTLAVQTTCIKVRPRQVGPKFTSSWFMC